MWSMALILLFAHRRDLLQAHDAAYQRWVPAQGPHTGVGAPPVRMLRGIPQIAINIFQPVGQAWL